MNREVVAEISRKSQNSLLIDYQSITIKNLIKCKDST